MSINTLVFIVLEIDPRAPNCFEMKDIEVFIEFIIVNELLSYFGLFMCKRTKFTHFTCARIYQFFTHLLLIFLRTELAFKFIMRFRAAKVLLTMISILNGCTNFRVISHFGPSSIKHSMKIYT